MTPPPPPLPVVVLISGRGSNMHALIEGSREASRNYRVAAVFSDRSSAGGLAIARGLGVPAHAVGAAGDRATYETLLATAIDEHAPALIALAGFMRILSAQFVARYAGRILNIHPSLLPKHPGLHTHRRALEARDGVHGATVHFVSEQLDAGAAVIQARTEVRPGEGEQSLAARVLALEHRIYPIAVGWYCRGRLRCIEGRAWLDGRALSAPVEYDLAQDTGDL